jgi:hypothetical protein
MAWHGMPGSSSKATGCHAGSYTCAGKDRAGEMVARPRFVLHKRTSIPAQPSENKYNVWLLLLPSGCGAKNSAGCWPAWYLPTAPACSRFNGQHSAGYITPCGNYAWSPLQVAIASSSTSTAQLSLPINHSTNQLYVFLAEEEPKKSRSQTTCSGS